MLGKLLISFLVSASPFGEMKTALPIAINSTEINDWGALLFCIAGNLMVYPIVDYLISNYGSYIFKNKKAQRSIARVRSHTRSKTQNLIEKYGFWGLMVFVMVPIPGTGAYLGTFAAYIFGIDKKDAFSAISIGVVLSGILLFAFLKGGAHLISLTGIFS